MKSKRIGYLSAAPRVSTRPFAAASGPRAHVIGVIRALEAEGWDVKQYIVGDRVPAKMVEGSTEKALSKNRLSTLLADIIRLVSGVINGRKAWNEIGNQVDWVYERYAVLQTLGSIFKKKGVPWVLETNGIFFEEAKAERKSLVLTGIAKKIELAAYHTCDVLVCVSESLKELLIEKAGVHPDKILVVPNGVDTSFYDPERVQPHREFTGFTVGFVGSLIAWQGIQLLLEAISGLRKEGLPINATIVGDGSAREEWEELVATLGIKDYVKFTGRKPSNEIPAYISGFDIGYSGQVQLKIGKMYHSPLKIYEYMSMGKPVIASAYDDAKKLIEQQGTGYLFAPGNVQELKEALRTAYIHRESLKNMGMKARQEIIAHHSWVSRMRETLPKIQQIIREGQGK